MSNVFNINTVLTRAKQRLETSDTCSLVIVRREEMGLAELVAAEIHNEQWQMAMRVFHASRNIRPLNN